MAAGRPLKSSTLSIIPPYHLAAHWLINPSPDGSMTLSKVDQAIALNIQYNAQKFPRLHIAGIKTVCDGIIDACTAALAAPYFSNNPHSGPLWTFIMLAPVAQRADAAGLQCVFHTIGNLAVKNAIEVLEEHNTPCRRHRNEHPELTHPGDAERLNKSGITASIQPVHTNPAVLRAWPKLLGPERCDRAFAYKEFLDAGVMLAMGSDAPCSPYAPLSNLYVGTTKRSAREPASAEAVNAHFTLPLVEVMAAATEGVAYSCFADGWTGKLEKGRKADFLVLDMEWKVEKLMEARTAETWFHGRQVWDRMD